MNLSQKRFKTHNFKWTFNSLKSIKIIKENLNRKELVNRLNHTNSKLNGGRVTKYRWKSGEFIENFTENFTESEKNYLKNI